MWNSGMDSDFKGVRAMVNDYEKEQLQRDYLSKPGSVVGLLLTCAAGLLVVFFLVLVGFDIQNFPVDASGRVVVTTP
jgi:hypothetical protein